MTLPWLLGYTLAALAIATATGQVLRRTARAKSTRATVANISGYAGRNTTLLLYFLLVVQSSDVMQYVWGKLLGKRPVAPRISPNKTWEGLIGGSLTATAIGTALYGATPFQPWQAAAMSAT